MKEGSPFPPGPKFVFGAYFAFYRDTLGYLQRVTRRYGDIVHMAAGAHHDYVIAHPDYVETAILADEKKLLRSIHRPLKRLFGKGLLGSQGEFHASQRRLIQPFFHRQRIAAYTPPVVEYSQRLNTRWRDAQIVDIAQEMTRLTMAIIVKVLFGADVENGAREIARNLETIVAMTNRTKIPFHSARKFAEARAKLDEFIYRLIDEHRRANLAQPDFLSALLNLQTAEGSAAGQSDEQIRDEAMTMFVAGHETVASAMAWTWYLLSVHPDVQARVQHELDAVLERRIPALEDLPRLTYTAMVFSESMRLYPPVWVMTRRSVGEFRLGEYDVPAGSYIHICQYLLHRDSRFFPDPDRFDPMRWTPEAAAARPKYCYFPFGAGSRKCVGDNFAFVEGMLILAILAQHWTMRLVSGRNPKPQPLVSLRPPDGMMIELRRRSPAEAEKISGRAPASAEVKMH